MIRCAVRSKKLNLDTFNLVTTICSARYGLADMFRRAKILWSWDVDTAEAKSSQIAVSDKERILSCMRVGINHPYSLFPHDEVWDSTVSFAMHGSTDQLDLCWFYRNLLWPYPENSWDAGCIMLHAGLTLPYWNVISQLMQGPGFWRFSEKSKDKNLKYTWSDTMTRKALLLLINWQGYAGFARWYQASLHWMFRYKPGDAVFTHGCVGGRQADQSMKGVVSWYLLLKREAFEIGNTCLQGFESVSSSAKCSYSPITGPLSES